jgi:predicted RNA-binding protein YlqC (UPF0109 family)
VQELVEYMVNSVVHHADDVSLSVTEGDASVLFELKVNDEDRARLTDSEGQLIGAMRQILAASSGTRRGVLELVGDADAAAEE